MITKKRIFPGGPCAALLPGREVADFSSVEEAAGLCAAKAGGGGLQLTETVERPCAHRQRSSARPILNGSLS